MNKNIQKLVKNYLSNKEKPTFYTCVTTDDFGYDRQEWLVQIDDEDLKALKALREKYGDDYINHTQGAIDEWSDITMDGTARSLDLDHPHHLYALGIVTFEGDKAKRTEYMALLADEDHAKLVEHFVDYPNFNIHCLGLEDPDLYKRVMDEVEDHFRTDDETLMFRSTYAVTLDEAESDAAAIRKANNMDDAKERWRSYWLQGQSYHWKDADDAEFRKIIESMLGGPRSSDPNGKQ